MKEKIYHITKAADWDKAKADGVYRPGSLEKDGFIHCSYSEQILGVANSVFKGMEKLVLLSVYRSRIKCRVVDEDLYDVNEEFPHVYGPIPVEAVFDVVPFECGEDGSFSLPSNVSSQ